MADVKITALPAAPAVTLDDLVAIVNDPAGSPVTQRAALNQIIYFTKVLTAYIGGDQTGNARGAYALDIQSKRLLAAKVASGSPSICVGYNCLASGNFSTAIGYLSKASANNTVALGYTCYAAGLYGVAIGLDCFAYGNQSVSIGEKNQSMSHYSSCIGTNCVSSGYVSNSIGYAARGRIDYTTNLIGPLINRKDNAEAVAQNFWVFSGAEVVLMTQEINLKTVADTTITLPAGAHFFPTEVGVIVTSANTVTVQPTVRFGFTGTPAGWVAAVGTTGLLAAFDRNRFTTLVSVAGQTSAVGGVTVGATATTLLGRFYFSGLLIEDE